MEIQLEQEQSVEVPIELEADDGESLLVAF
jgi:hypothetical protein